MDASSRYVGFPETGAPKTRPFRCSFQKRRFYAVVGRNRGFRPVETHTECAETRDGRYTLAVHMATWVRVRMALLSLTGIVLAADAQSPTKLPPVEDYPASRNWSGENAPLNLVLPSERVFKTRLAKAASEKANFADHFRFTSWGCGSNCAAGAFVDLETGRVIQPPLTAGTAGWDRWMFCWQAFQGAGVWTRPDGRLLIIRCGKALIERLDDVVPDTYYFIWEGSRFKLVAHKRADVTPPPN